MILGIGNDLVRIDRIEKTLERFGDRFIQRVFTEVEQAKSERRAQRAASYAKRFAAKEACSKALGTGVPRKGVHWRDMGRVRARGIDVGRVEDEGGTERAEYGSVVDDRTPATRPWRTWRYSVTKSGPHRTGRTPA